MNLPDQTQIPESLRKSLMRLDLDSLSPDTLALLHWMKGAKISALLRKALVERPWENDVNLLTFGSEFLEQCGYRGTGVKNTSSMLFRTAIEINIDHEDFPKFSNFYSDYREQGFSVVDSRNICCGLCSINLKLGDVWVMRLENQRKALASGDLF